VFLVYETQHRRGMLRFLSLTEPTSRRATFPFAGASYPQDMAEPTVDLIRRAQSGDEAALVALVESQQTYTYSVALSIVRNEADAADVTQEAFIRLFRSLHTYRAETKFTTWFYRLVSNLSIDTIRRRGQAIALPDGPGPDRDCAGEPISAAAWTQPDLDVERRESADEIRAALDRLPAAQRAAVTMYYFEDARYEEIAQAMGLPLNTVKSHIRRGKERLAIVMREPATNVEEVRTPCAATM
jgi:RNA polymerase sigma-70 factor (ECF subfamily)